MDKIKEAMDTLRDAGYYVDNLWHVNDVFSRFDCDEQTAQDILDQSLGNDATIEQIWFAMDFHIDMYKENN